MQICNIAVIKSEAQQLIHNWFHNRNWTAHPFQIECAEKYFQGYSGLLNAPTGSGKTFALALPAIVESMLKISKISGPYLLWITPLRALATDIANAIQEAANELDANWTVKVRNGDTTTSERQKQKNKPPQCWVITPESLHLLFTQKQFEQLFKNTRCIVVDEWHELLGTKRAVQVELALSRLKTICPKVKIWGISATIGNLLEARDVLVPEGLKVCSIIAKIEKRIEIKTVYPDSVETYPWSGHLGISMVPKVCEILNHSDTTLIFTNTRSQCEIWYQRLLEYNVSLAGRIAIHHGSLERETREWVEESLHKGILKAVVCTSSLDLGVDFRPVDTVIQIGGPKGVARFAQRAGRSGHQPGKTSIIYFVPTHSLELVEAAALKSAILQKKVESKIPFVRTFDVLIQYCLTLATGDGLEPKKVWQEIKNTFSFKDISEHEWEWCLHFLLNGGEALSAYDEYKKVVNDNGIIKIASRKFAMQHRLSIGTIDSIQNMSVKFLSGKKLGTIEEYFISKLNIGDHFVFTGKVLQLAKLEGLVAYVNKSNRKKGIIPAWGGGRMSLSNELSNVIRSIIQQYFQKNQCEEVQFLKPLFQLQKEISAMPQSHEILIESLFTEEGHHVFIFPFQGRMIHEGLATLLAYRLNHHKKQTFSISVNDYGFELLSDDEININLIVAEEIWETMNLIADIKRSANFTELHKRKFNSIAKISGLIYQGNPDQPIRSRHLHATTKLLFNVFEEYDPENLLLRQASEEVFYYQLEEYRLREALQQIAEKQFVVKEIQKPTPFSFQIMVERMQRFSLTTADLESRINKILAR